ncbi:MAG: Glyoxalase/bleomycin resistance protein/dioxygenase [Thermoleophilia bacterium]|nr:Glyoxalase/bleomycin resistance protein/dioxygenase [Thermoleophilia bacterium]MCZ4497018.1 Glyoxalase/bleomycin resistance protein/dioxygenase [Thermoleophilia bacterium]
MQLDGIHHITCITADAPRNVDFYARVLGLRLAKKTVNQDDPTVYHLFYTDEAGTPGSDLTFFEYPGARRGAVGAGMVHRIRYRVASSDSLDWWEDRLRAEGAPVSRGPDDSLRFQDPEGLALELVVRDDIEDAPLVARSTEVPGEHALQGFDGVDALVADFTGSELVVDRLLGFADRGDHTWESRGPRRGGTITFEQSDRRGMGGAGTVHHIAFAAETADIEGWAQRVADAGAHGTPVVDRFWFRSVYFREPGGILYELATQDPGFTADESLETLGETLVLPPAYEPARAQIEPQLTPLPDTRQWRPTPG